MSSTTDQNGPAPHDGWWHRTQMWLGHYHARIDITALAVAIPTGIAADLAPHGWLATSLAAASVASIAVLLTADSRIRYHGRHLCARHLMDTPLTDPDRAVQRRDRQLRAYHRFNVRRYAFGAASCYAVSLVALFAFHVPFQAAFIPLYGLVVVDLYRGWRYDIHQRLQPWCPYCRDDGDDEGFQPVDPTNPTVSRRPKPVATS